MKQHFIIVGFIWLVITVIGEWFALSVNLYPLAAAKETEVVDGAFRQLMVMGTPIFGFVIAVLLYSVFRFRAPGEPQGAGATLHGRNWVPQVWLAVTGALAIFVIFNPGVQGMMELQHLHTQADMVIKVEATRFFFKVTYPAQGVANPRELVLPVNKRIRVETTAVDVIHSFWIPAFRQKIDSVPGRVTSAIITPNKIASYADDPNMRLQCAELCGAGHAVMMLPVRVVSEKDFDAWVAQAKSQ